MKFISLVSTILLFAACVAAQKSVLSEPYLMHPPPLVSVLANPEKYDGKRVTVTGFLHFQFEDSALYLSKDDGDYLNLENAIWIRYSDSPRRVWRCPQNEPAGLDNDYFNGKYVTLTGTFNMKERGHLAAFSGTLENVTSIVEERRWYDGSRKVVKQDKDGRISDKCQ
jgi:hypothetical protein